MSTNFYWLCHQPPTPAVMLPTGKTIRAVGTVIPDEMLHIGKRFSAGGGAMGFTLAISPWLLLKTLNKHDSTDWKIIADEYGREFSASEFSTILFDCRQWNTHCIGTEFS